jgi:site-specific DNA-methyltransferase (adenine-specific)
MGELPDDSVDLIATDPPYGLKFMGLKWDKAIPRQEIFNEMLRVLKPGAFAFVMTLPRQDLMSRMIIRLEDAGFNVNFSPIFWVYATGWNKSMNMSKAIDKAAGNERKGLFKKGVGQDTGYNRKFKQEYETGNPVSPEAQKFDGSYAGMQLKPACEIILVAMKPLTEKTYIEQALKNGKGVTWLDGGRIPVDENEPNLRENAKNHITNEPCGFEAFVGKEKVKNRNEFLQDKGLHNSKGRFPANILVSDNTLDDGRNTKSSGGNQKNRKGAIFGSGKFSPESVGLGDSGDFSRYFSLDLWAAANLNKRQLKTYPFILVPKPSRREKGGLNHQTVKPLELFEYLIVLGSRAGDLVLDPFSGSSTCLIAAAARSRDYIGCEKNRKNYEEGLRRIRKYIVQREEKEIC